MPRPTVVLQREFERLEEDAALQPSIEDRERGLHAPEQVALHPVGACAVQLVRAAGLEEHHAAVFEETTQDRTHPDVLGDSRDAGSEATHASNDQVDLHARLRGAVERLDHLRLGERVHLRDDARRLALICERRFTADEREQRLVQREW